MSYSWCFFAWPLLAVHLGAGRLAEAIDAGRQLLLPPQQRLPDELEVLLEAALTAWERAEPAPAGEKLAEALQWRVAWVMPERPLRLGLVGCGYQGNCLAEAAARTTSASVVACADPDLAAAEKVASLGRCQHPPVGRAPLARRP